MREAIRTDWFAWVKINTMQHMTFQELIAEFGLMQKGPPKTRLRAL